MLKLNYDEENDILYISINYPQPSYGEEGVPGIVVLKSIDTDDITGVTIFDFNKRVKEKKIESTIMPFEINWQRDVLPHYH